MTASIEPLILDLLEWVEKEPRAYADVMDAWRTSCPRLPIWEEATIKLGEGHEQLNLFDPLD